MSEEQTGTPTVEHVSMSDSGVILLSPEAEAALSGEEWETTADPAKEEPAQPQEGAPTKRKIKWMGDEVEIAPEQETELLQKGYNYEQKMQQLEQEKARLQAYSGLVNAIEGSPAIKQKVAAALGYGEQKQEAEPVEFDDPIEQLKWETRQAVLKEVEEKFIKPITAQSAQQAHMQRLNMVKQQVSQDPQYIEIQNEIVKTIQSMPEGIAKNLYIQLDQDPVAYMDMFNTVKQRMKPLTTNQPQASTSTQRATKAPLLETTQVQAPDASEERKQTDRIKELTRRSKEGDFRATGELLEMMA
jgi:hypothetical protein